MSTVTAVSKARQVPRLVAAKLHQPLQARGLRVHGAPESPGRGHAYYAALGAPQPSSGFASGNDHGWSTCVADILDHVEAERRDA